MRPTLRLLLQRAWHAIEPAADWLIRCLPNSVKLIMFRGLVKALRVRAVSVEGSYGRFQGDPLDLGVLSEYMLTGSYSPELIKFLLDWFQRFGAGTMIDVGANIGLTALPVAMSGVECVCFEPDLNNFNLLKANTENTVWLSWSNFSMSQSSIAVVRFRSKFRTGIDGDHRVRLVDLEGGVRRAASRGHQSCRSAA